MGTQRAISIDVYRHQKQVGGSEPREPVKAQLPKKGPEGKGRSPVHNSTRRGAGPSPSGQSRTDSQPSLRINTRKKQFWNPMKGSPLPWAEGSQCIIKDTRPRRRKRTPSPALLINLHNKRGFPYCIHMRSLMLRSVNRSEQPGSQGPG